MLRKPTLVRAPPHPSSFLRRLGPGLITGAADDDPSGIATYSQVGAQFGYGLAWTMLFSLPFMIVVQEISGRIGCVTGHGIAGNLRRHYPGWSVRTVVLLLLAANIFNLGADLGAMGAALRLLVGGDARLYTLGFGIVCIVAETLLPYRPYASVLKWLTLSLFAYVGVVFAAHVPVAQAVPALFLPHLPRTAVEATALVAVLGTTISPYLFFWQSSLEVEERGRRGVPPLRLAPAGAPAEFARIRLDTIVGMTVSNVVAVFIIWATAATLHASGVTTIESSAQAAQALRPIAGELTFWVFAAGVVGTGLLAIPVLAGSCAYALSEAFRWRTGLDRRLFQAKSFYAALAIATLAGVAMNFTSLNPIKALYWSAVLNGLLSAPVIAAMLLIGSNARIMGRLTLSRSLQVAGWSAAGIMLLASVAFFVL